MQLETLVERAPQAQSALAVASLTVALITTLNRKIYRLTLMTSSAQR
jgi:hypothetical protein